MSASVTPSDFLASTTIGLLPPPFSRGFRSFSLTVAAPLTALLISEAPFEHLGEFIIHVYKRRMEEKFRHKKKFNFALLFEVIQSSQFIYLS